MNEYAHQALEKISTAMRLVASYFNDEKEDFVQRYFPGRKKMLERATSEQSYQRIVDDLKNTAQSAIVSASTEQNMLILAGPGAGKTQWLPIVLPICCGLNGYNRMPCWCSVLTAVR